jgi:hypothetical protein
MASVCIVDECEKPRGQNGRMCFMHQYRLRKFGSTDDPRLSWQERFWAKVQKGPECWVWTACTDRRGYGMLQNAPIRAAHRLSYLLTYGDPGSHHVLHRCDNPPCVNPAHLFLGDDADNHADMASKRRSTWGEKNHHAKLQAADVLAIRAQLRAGRRQREIAEEFGVSRATISDIGARRSWYHLPDEAA